MDYTEKWGKDIEEAVSLALIDLKVSRDEVEVTVLEEPTKGFLGLGAKLAKVRVEKIKKEEPKPQPVAEPETKEPEKKTSEKRAHSKKSTKSKEKKSGSLMIINSREASTQKYRKYKRAAGGGSNVLSKLTTHRLQGASTTAMV